MWWRLRRSEFNRQTGQERKCGMKSTVDSGEIPGLLAYAGVVSAFRRAGFVEVLRRSPRQSIMRYFMEGESEG
jgi:hypothetical protein